MPDEKDIRSQAAERRLAAQRTKEARLAGQGPWPPEGKRTPHQQTEVEAYEVAVEWLKEKWGNEPECPFCRNKEWSVGVATRIINSASVPPDAAFGALPSVFPVMCTNCGHTVFVSAVFAGIVPEPDEGP